MRSILCFSFLFLQLTLQAHANIIILSHYAGESDYLAHTIPNQREYAARHGYKYSFREGILSNEFCNPNSTQKKIADGLYWQKLVAVKDALNAIDPETRSAYDWVLWVDADALFTNMDQTIESIIEKHANPSTDLLIASDHFIVESFDFLGLSAVNAGVFLLRNTRWSRKFVDEWIGSFEKYKDGRTPEQTAMGALLGNFDENDSCLKRSEKQRLVEKNPHVVVVPQRSLNAKWVDDFVGPPEAVWRGGDFLIHFFGPKAFKEAIPVFLECLKNDQSGKSCEWSSLGSYAYSLKALYEVLAE